MFLWIKALHIISIIAWMAGLLYLPRLFVYHCAVAPGSEAYQLFTVMERRLLRFIMAPAMTAAYVFGIWMLVLIPELLHDPWLHAKLSLVVLLTVIHHLMIPWHRAFAEDRNHRSSRFFRIANEIPTVLMIGIVILVVVKPF